jgi:hypothetical protein
VILGDRIYRLAIFKHALSGLDQAGFDALPGLDRKVGRAALSAARFNHGVQFSQIRMDKDSDVAIYLVIDQLVCNRGNGGVDRYLVRTAQKDQAHQQYG